MAAPKRGTSTSNFGVGKRESHDASGFYARFTPPEITGDDLVLDPVEVDRAIGAPLKVGDSTDMREVPDGSVALVVTSPPYFAGKKYEEDLEADGIPGSYVEYLDMLEAVFAECVRTLEPGGRIAVNVANLGRKPYRSLSADVITLLQDKLRLLLRGEIIWQKQDGANGSCAWGSFGKPANPTLRDITERVIVASKGRFDRARSQRERERTGLPFEQSINADRFMDATLDVWHIPAESAKRVNHPAPFPSELPEWLIDLHTYRGELVLDPFMGSGSTMVAAVRTDRRYVGYDLDPAYVDLAKTRVEEERRRRPVVAPPLPLATHTAGSLRNVVDSSADEPTVDEDADFQARATKEGKASQAIAERVLVQAGFTIVARNARLRGLGMTMNFIAVDARENPDEPWYFDVSGAFSSNRGGLRRTDTMWKSLGRAHVLANQPDHQNARLVLLTSHLPRPGSDGDRALRAATPEAYFDAIAMLSDQGQERLRAYATGEHTRPLAGFWEPLDIEESRRWGTT